jgi:GNAT superfamily N-acetyltransferase
MPAHLTPRELVEPINTAYREAFPTIVDGVDEKGIEWSDGEFRVLAWDDEAWGAIVEILKRTITVGEQTVVVGGVGGVMTLPTMRGRGIASSAMRHAADFICDELRADAGVLFCVPDLMPFYAKLGWYDLQRKFTYHQSDGVRVMDTRNHADGCAMFKPCRDFVFPYGPIDVGGKLW